MAQRAPGVVVGRRRRLVFLSPADGRTAASGNNRRSRRGAILGGLIGGAVTGRAGGAVAGALVGGTTGALIGAEAERRHGYYWWRGSCYYQYPSAEYAVVGPRYCN